MCCQRERRRSPTSASRRNDGPRCRCSRRRAARSRRVHGLVPAAGRHAPRQQPVEQPRGRRVAVAQRVHEADAVHAPPAPARRVGAVIARSARRARRAAPRARASSQSRPPISSASPSSHSSSSRAWKRHGDEVIAREADAATSTASAPRRRRRRSPPRDTSTREVVVNAGRSCPPTVSGVDRGGPSSRSRSIARTLALVGRLRAARAGAAVSRPGIEKTSHWIRSKSSSEWRSLLARAAARCARRGSRRGTRS